MVIKSIIGAASISLTTLIFSTTASAGFIKIETGGAGYIDTDNFCSNNCQDILYENPNLASVFNTVLAIHDLQSWKLTIFADDNSNQNDSGIYNYDATIEFLTNDYGIVTFRDSSSIDLSYARTFIANGFGVMDEHESLEPIAIRWGFETASAIFDANNILSGANIGWGIDENVNVFIATTAEVDYVVNGTQYNSYRFGGIYDFADYFTVTKSQPVPIPAAVWLFGSGLVGLIGLARRKHT